MKQRSEIQHFELLFKETENQYPQGNIDSIKRSKQCAIISPIVKMIKCKEICWKLKLLNKLQFLT